jgi:DNA-binding transcriptional regulator YhcF (GntR family)
MKLVIDARSAVPPFEQLRTQVLDAAADGSAPAGLKLPTVRALALELGIAANTVAKSYRQLELDGVIETRGRAGSFIATSGDSTRRQVQDAAAAFADRVRQLHFDPAAALELVAAALK